MAYIVDIVNDLVSRMGSVQPHYFQRNGAFFAITQRAFGQVSFGLETWHDGDVKEEFEASTNVITGFGDDGRDRRPQFAAGEQERLAPIVFGSDDYRCTLEDVFTTARALSSLPPDGKIRMVRHASGYRSHKYGYAADGIDVWLDDARVMDVDTYFALMRKREDAMLARAKSFGAAEQQVIPDDCIPDAFVMTPLLLASFPRKGVLDPHADHPPVWTSRTDIAHHEYGAAIGYRQVDASDETPFGAHVIINSLTRGGDPLTLGAEMEKYTNDLRLQITCVESVMPQVADITGRLNTIHQQACAKSIAFRKSLRTSRD